MLPLLINKPCSPGGIAQAVAVGAAVQKVDHQGLLGCDYHLADQNTDHQAINLDVQFAPGDIVQGGLGIFCYTAQGLLRQVCAVGKNIIIFFQQMGYGSADSWVVSR